MDGLLPAAALNETFGGSCEARGHIEAVWAPVGRRDHRTPQDSVRNIEEMEGYFLSLYD